MTPAQVREAAVKVSGREGPYPIKCDTSDFFAVQAGDVVALGEEYYLIRGEVREGRFGMEGEPKFWVKRALKLPEGRRVIMKLVFFESFEANVAGFKFRCYRSPEKEGRILQKVAHHPGFMHGHSLRDEKGNLVRVLEVIPGPTLADIVGDLHHLPHEVYFDKHFPDLFRRFAQAIEDLAFLHDQGEVHGDVRRDHLILDSKHDRLRWIDFDYSYHYSRANRFAYDLFGLGNSILFLVGGGVWSLSRLRRKGYNALLEKLEPDDMNVVFHNNLADLKKLFPYLPEELNLICLHFSEGAPVFYEHAWEILDDMHRFLKRR